MDPLERADAALARARARGAFVVTPESAVSPMDAASTLQIPRVVVSENDGRRGDTENPLCGRRDEPAQENIPAIAQEAPPDYVGSPRQRRTRQRRIEDARARGAVEPPIPQATPAPAQPAPIEQPQQPAPQQPP